MNGRAERDRKRGRWFRIALWIHRWTGLVATPFFLVLCVTGSILVFHEEIDAALGYVTITRDSAPADHPRPWHELIAGVLRPGERAVSVYYDPETPRRLSVTVAPEGYATLEAGEVRLVDTLTARPLTATNPRDTPTDFLLRLHSEWLAGLPGELFGGAVAVLVTLCLVSGIPIYAPHVRAVAFGAVRRDRGMRVLQRDLHNAVGAVIFGWIMVVTVTGALLATSSLLFDAYQKGELQSMSASVRAPAATGMVDVETAVARLAVAAPSLSARYIVFPDTDYSGPNSFTAFLYGTKRYNARTLAIGIVEAGTGEVRALRDLPWPLVAIAFAQPLHFGNYGGYPLKILWLAASWAILFVTGNGAWLWFHRRRLHLRARPA